MRPLARSLSWTACGLPAHTPATTGYQTPHRAQSGRPPTFTGQRRLWTRLEQVFPDVKHMFEDGKCGPPADEEARWPIDQRASVRIHVPVGSEYAAREPLVDNARHMLTMT